MTGTSPAMTTQRCDNSDLCIVGRLRQARRTVTGRLANARSVLL
jgi:hypothetical protein